MRNVGVTRWDPLRDLLALHERVGQIGQLVGRAFALPEAIDVERVSADLRDGLLTVTIAKASRSRSRKLPTAAVNVT